MQPYLQCTTNDKEGASGQADTTDRDTKRTRLNLPTRVQVEYKLSALVDRPRHLYNIANVLSTGTSLYDQSEAQKEELDVSQYNSALVDRPPSLLHLCANATSAAVRAQSKRHLPHHRSHPGWPLPVMPPATILRPPPSATPTTPTTTTPATATAAQPLCRLRPPADSRLPAACSSNTAKARKRSCRSCTKLT